MSPGAILLAALLREEGHIDLDESEIGAEGEFARAAATLDRLLEAADMERDRLWCKALIPEGAEVIQRVTTRAIALRVALATEGERGASGPPSYDALARIAEHWRSRAAAAEALIAKLGAAPADGPTRETVSAALDAAGCPSLGRWILHSSASEWDALNAGFRGGVAPASPGDFLRQHAAGVPDFAKLHAEHTARQLDEAVREAAPGLLSAVPANPRTADKLGAAPPPRGER